MSATHKQASTGDMKAMVDMMFLALSMVIYCSFLPASHACAPSASVYPLLQPAT